MTRHFYVFFNIFGTHTDNCKAQCNKGILCLDRITGQWV